jgi:HTH-type transcriptional regulator, competence development regulator
MEINGATLKALRALNGYDLKTLSTASGVSMSYICEIEKGRDVKVRPATMKKLADALSVPIAALARDPKTVEKPAKVKAR